MVVKPQILVPAYPPPQTPMTPRTSPITDLAIHHSAGPKEQTPLQIDAEERASSEHYSMMPYNWLIDASGRIYSGRPTNVWCGATFGRNPHCVAICVIGDFQKGDPGYNGPPSMEQVDALVHMIAWVHEEYPTITRTYAHGDVEQLFYANDPDRTAKYGTACCGSDLRAMLPEIIAYAHALAGGMVPASVHAVAHAAQQKAAPHPQPSTRQSLVDSGHVFFQADSQRSDLLDPTKTQDVLIRLLSSLVAKGHFLEFTAVRSDHHDDRDLGFHCHANGYCADLWPLRSAKAGDYLDASDVRFGQFLFDAGSAPNRYQIGLVGDGADSDANFGHAIAGCKVHGPYLSGVSVFHDDGGAHVHLGAA